MRAAPALRPAGAASPGRVVRVNGPLVEIEGLLEVAVRDLVEVGAGALPAEILSVERGFVRAQVFEYTGGLRVGEPAVGRRGPLSARLGPGLLGGIFDGLLRPLSGQDDFLAATTPAAAAGGGWRFVPTVAAGALLSPGAVLGTIETASGIEHRVLVPAGVEGKVEAVRPPGEVGEDVPVARVGGTDVAVTETWPVRRARPARERLPLAEPLVTGQRVFDLLFPIAKGGTAAVPGGFGTGKTFLLQQILRWSEADVLVFVGCGERGNELANALAELSSLSDPATGRSLRERTVVIANTSNMPVMAREASIFTGMTVAEYYRDMGYHVVLLADSTSRWAEALREFASRAGELPAEEGFPAGLASALASFYERAGRVTTLGGRDGSVTAIGAVSPPGGDMTEPVTVHTERLVRCLWSLDRDLAYARHYPAVTWRRSFSRDAEELGNFHATAGRPGWRTDRARAVDLLAAADRLAPMVELVGMAAMPPAERVVLLGARLLREAVLQQSALSPLDLTCEPAKAAALLSMVLTIYDACRELVGSGVAPGALEAADFTGATRARDEFAPDDAAGVERRCAEILTMLESLR